MKNKLILLTAVCFTLLLASCLGSDSNTGYEVPKNCQISTFKLTNDSVSGLSSVRFTIDQLNGRIFNIDSMPYGTEVDKAICTIEYLNSYAVIFNQVIQMTTGDTIYWNGTDSLDFSKPVKFVVGAYDGLTTKTYTAQLNIHQVKPDTMIWTLYADHVTGQTNKAQKVITCNYQNKENYFMYVDPAEAGQGYQLFYSPVSESQNWTQLPLNGLPGDDLLISQITTYKDILYLPSLTGELYQSTDGLNWTIISNAPKVVALLGALKEGVHQSSALTAVVDANGTWSFATMSESKEWTVGDAVPSGFPVTGFGTLGYYAMYNEYLMVVAGRDKNNTLTNMAWATTNGKSWVTLTDSKSNYFDKREGIMLTAYDNKFFLIGGINESGTALKDVFSSKDNGVTWVAADTVLVLPDAYTARGFSSIQVDANEYMLIFGGKTNSNANDLDQIWRGRINRLGFK